jgi:hypothetical protein
MSEDRHRCRDSAVWSRVTPGDPTTSVGWLRALFDLYVNHTVQDRRPGTEGGSAKTHCFPVPSFRWRRRKLELLRLRER